ncbi:flavin-containing monooxygenase [Corynebacterium anserum]|uniref:flavin-containing monooxygenase n=1 Tax=Corynebacterium anserum TaxID=2684406 RepID=UPI00163B34D8|nr:NAD(P)/FAD-dependent oxidoreductase [Corynebacterium anserum]
MSTKVSPINSSSDAHDDAHVHDLVIVGAGVSGVDLAHHVSKRFPQWDWIAVDSNSDVGGTWNTFTYPGIRSDSDMATFSFPFKKWPHSGTLGSGSNIKEYVRDVAQEVGLLDRLQLSTWVERANFHTDSGLWELTVKRGAKGSDMSEGGEGGVEGKESGTPPSAETDTIWTKRVHFAAGYYKHSEGFTANIPGLENFGGTVVHPQRWPEGLDVRGKKIVIIGSGATAVTLLPSLHNMGADTTMLQRTPTYIAPLPEVDSISAAYGAILPEKIAVKAARTTHIWRDMIQYWLCQGVPTVAKGAFWAMNRRFISAKEIKQNFTPPYNPWDQRVCKAPGGDIFKAINDGAKVVTARIKQVEAEGVRLDDGRLLECDILITATGLKLQTFGNAELAIDGVSMNIPSLVSYRGLMLNALPNFSYTIGYFNQSWTLRADMVSRYVVELWKDMEKRNQRFATPLLPQGVKAELPLLEMSSGYIQRSVDELPRQGESDPWRIKHDYVYESRRLLSSDRDHDMAFDSDAIAAAKNLAQQGQATAVGV